MGATRWRGNLGRHSGMSRYERSKLIVGVVAILVGVPTAIGAIGELRSTSGEPALRLEAPARVDGSVGSVTVTGWSKLPDRHHFLVVTAPQGVRYVQDGGPLSLSETGRTVGSVALGSAQEGGGEEFRIQLVATRERLVPGPMAALPGDAVVSDQVVVIK